MSIDYKQELMNLLNQPFYTMPSKEVINNDKDIALAVWNNFSRVESLSNTNGNQLKTQSNNELAVQKWYEGSNWKSHLETYKNDMSFWDSAIKKYNYAILLNHHFKRDFPEVFNHYVKNIDKIKEIFYESKNLSFFKLMNCSREEKIETYKNYMQKNPSLITSNEFKIYGKEITSKEFFVTVLRSKPEFFQYINDKYKSDEQLIRISLLKIENYRYVPTELKEKYFFSWYEDYKKNPKSSEIKFLPYNLQEKVITSHPELLADLFNHEEFENKRYNDLLKFALSKNPKDFINTIKIESLRQISIEPNDITTCLPALQRLVDKYSYKETKEYFHKIRYFSSFDKNLQQSLDSNPCFQLNHSFYMKNKLSNFYFEKYFDYLLELENKKKLNHEKVENLLLFARGHLTIDDLKLHRYPKSDLYLYMKRRKLSNSLEENLDDDKQQVKRMKL